ncbi:arginine transporter permease subunit ArtM [Vibrio mediterranei AK1]|nr:arginine transporter permease subunit ArtM [Vibrio mediterranei AK1]
MASSGNEVDSAGLLFLDLTFLRLVGIKYPDRYLATICPER